MVSKRFTTYLIIFNAIMGLLLFLSSQLVLLILNGTIVENIGIYIDYGFPYTDAPIPTMHAPLPNYPLLVFIFTLIGNAIFIVSLRRKNKAEIRSKSSS